MTKPTKDENTAKETGGKADLWQRLLDLATSFSHASVRQRSEELEDVGLVLNALYHAPGFRRVANSALEAYIVREYRETEHPAHRRTQKGRHQSLLFVTEHAIERHGGDAAAVALAIVEQIAIDVPLLSRAPLAPASLPNPERLLTIDSDAKQEAVASVTTAIGPLLADVNPEAVIKKAMQALGADLHYVKNMFR